MAFDLNTHEMALEALILEDYGNNEENESRKEEDKIRLFPDKQHYVDKTDPSNPTLYCFYDLDEKELRKLLKGKNFEYEIRDSKTGRILEVHKRQPANRLN